MSRYDNTLRSFASLLNVKSDSHATDSTPDPIIQGFLRSYCCNEGTSVTLPSLGIEETCDRTCASDSDGFPKKVLRRLVENGIPLPPTTSKAKGKKKLLNRAKIQSSNANTVRGPPFNNDTVSKPSTAAHEGVTGASESSSTADTSKRPLERAGDNLSNNMLISNKQQKSTKSEITSIEHLISKELYYSTEKSQWTEGDSSDGDKRRVKNVAYAPHILNNNVKHTIWKLVTNRLESYTSILIKKKLKTGDGAPDKSSAKILSHYRALIPPSELFDQVRVMKSLINYQIKDPDSDSKKATDKPESAVSKDIRSTESASSVTLKTNENPQTSLLKDAENGTTKTLTNVNKIVTVDSTSRIEKELDTDKPHTSTTSITTMVPRKGSDSAVPDKNTINNDKDSAKMTPEVQQKSTTDNGQFNKGSNPTKVIPEDLSERGPIPSTTEKEDKSSDDCSRDPKIHESTENKTKKENKTFDPKKSYLFTSRKNRLQNSKPLARNNENTEEKVDHVAKIKTIHTKSPSFRSRIESELKLKQNLPSPCIIHSCETSFKVPPGVKRTAVTWKLHAKDEKKDDSKDSNDQKKIDDPKTPISVTEVSLPITFAAIVSVSIGIGGEKQSLEFGTAGTIKGLFHGTAKRCLLREVSITLQTDSLENYLLKQSRLLIKRAIAFKIQKNEDIKNKTLHGSKIEVNKENGSINNKKTQNRGRKKNKTLRVKDNKYINNVLQKTKHGYLSHDERDIEEKIDDPGPGSNSISVDESMDSKRKRNPDMSSISDGRDQSHSKKWRPSNLRNTSVNYDSNAMNFPSTDRPEMEMTRNNDPSLTSFERNFATIIPPRPGTGVRTNDILHDRRRSSGNINTTADAAEIVRLMEADSLRRKSGNSSTITAAESIRFPQRDALGQVDGITDEGRPTDLNDASSDANIYSGPKSALKRRRGAFSGDTMANAAEAVRQVDSGNMGMLSNVHRRQSYVGDLQHPRCSSGGLSSMSAAAEAVRLAELEAFNRASGGNSNPMMAAAEAVRAAELDALRRGSDASIAAALEVVRAAELEALRRRSSGGTASMFNAADAARIADMEGLRRRSGVSSLASSDMEALRRRSSGGSMAAAADAIRAADMEALRRRSGGASMLASSELEALRRRNSGGSMAAAADAIRAAELEALRRRSSGGTMGGPGGSMAAAADAVRAAELEALRRRSSGGAMGGPGGSMTAAAEAVRSAELEALRRRSSGGTMGGDSMSAAAEAVRAAEMDALRRRSSGGTMGGVAGDSMSAAAEAVRAAEMDALRRRSSGGTMGGAAGDSMSAAAEAVRAAEMDALRRRSSGGTLGGTGDSMSAAAEAVRAAEMDALRRRSSGGTLGGTGDSMSAAAEAVRAAEMDALRRRSSGGSMAAAAEAVRAAERDVFGRSNGVASNSMTAAAEAVRLLELEAMSSSIYSSMGRDSYGQGAVMSSDALRFAELDALQRSIGGPNPSIAKAADAVRFAELQAAMNGESGVRGPSFEAAQIADRLRMSSGGPNPPLNGGNGDNEMDAIARNYIGANQSMSAALEAVRRQEAARPAFATGEGVSPGARRVPDFSRFGDAGATLQMGSNQTGFMREDQRFASNPAVPPFNSRRQEKKRKVSFRSSHNPRVYE